MGSLLLLLLLLSGRQQRAAAAPCAACSQLRTRCGHVANVCICLQAPPAQLPRHITPRPCWSCTAACPLMLPWCWATRLRSQQRAAALRQTSSWQTAPAWCVAAAAAAAAAAEPAFTRLFYQPHCAVAAPAGRQRRRRRRGAWVLRRRRPPSGLPCCTAARRRCGSMLRDAYMYCCTAPARRLCMRVLDWFSQAGVPTHAASAPPAPQLPDDCDSNMARAIQASLDDAQRQQEAAAAAAGAAAAAAGGGGGTAPGEAVMDSTAGEVPQRPSDADIIAFENRIRSVGSRAGWTGDTTLPLPPCPVSTPPTTTRCLSSACWARACLYPCAPRPVPACCRSQGRGGQDEAADGRPRATGGAGGRVCRRLADLPAGKAGRGVGMGGEAW